MTRYEIICFIVLFIADFFRTTANLINRGVIMIKSHESKNKKKGLCKYIAGGLVASPLEDSFSTKPSSLPEKLFTRSRSIRGWRRDQR